MFDVKLDRARGWVRPMAYAWIAVIGCAAATPHCTRAAVAAEPSSLVVDYSDLDLSSPAAAVVLLKRIERAASAVCGDPGPTGDLSRRSRYRRCVAGTVAHAVGAVPSRTVAAAYAARYGTRSPTDLHTLVGRAVGRGGANPVTP